MKKCKETNCRARRLYQKQLHMGGGQDEKMSVCVVGSEVEVEGGGGWGTQVP